MVSLSALNGFEKVIFKSYQNYYADVKITPKKGKYFTISENNILKLKKLPQVFAISSQIEDQAILTINNKKLVVLIKGVDENYQKTVAVDSFILNGLNTLYKDDAPLLWLGNTAYYQLLAPIAFTNVSIMAPRVESFSTVNLDMNEYPITFSSVIEPGEELSDKLAITPIDFARDVFEKYDEITSLEVKLKNENDIKDFKSEAIKIVGNNFEILSRQEQNKSIYKMFITEKFFVIVIMSFVLLLVSFNLLGALTMLVLEKKSNINTLKKLGMKTQTIKHIFWNQSIKISSLGTIIGIVAGVSLILIQQKFELLSMNSEFSQAYPVNLRLTDIGLVLLIGIVMGLISGIYPTVFATKLNDN